MKEQFHGKRTSDKGDDWRRRRWRRRHWHFKNVKIFSKS